jgi:hypothetical protein
MPSSGAPPTLAMSDAPKFVLTEQKVSLVVPVRSQQSVLAMLYIVLTTAGLEDDLGTVVRAMQPPRVPSPSRWRWDTSRRG